VRKERRMGFTAQSHFQPRLKGFFRWAADIRLIDFDPSAALPFIATSDKRTQPLAPAQFEEPIAGIEPVTAFEPG